IRGLIHEVAEGTGARIVNPMLARLKRACKLHRDDEAEKVRALAREILNDWAAITAFVTNPDLPATNNEAERALRDAVIARRISNGTRTEEGSAAYAATLSVLETCRRRGVEPWRYITDLLDRPAGPGPQRSAAPHHPAFSMTGGGERVPGEGAHLFGGLGHLIEYGGHLVIEVIGHRADQFGPLLLRLDLHPLLLQRHFVDAEGILAEDPDSARHGADLVMPSHQIEVKVELATGNLGHGIADDPGRLDDHGAEQQIERHHQDGDDADRNQRRSLRVFSNLTHDRVPAPGYRQRPYTVALWAISHWDHHESVVVGRDDVLVVRQLVRLYEALQQTSVEVRLTEA